MCILFFFKYFFYLQLKLSTANRNRCMFSPLEEGVKLARNFLIFWNGDEAQRQVQRQKVQLKFEGMQLKGAVSFLWATVFLRLYPKHMVHLLR